MYTNIQHFNVIVCFNSSQNYLQQTVNSNLPQVNFVLIGSFTINMKFLTDDKEFMTNIPGKVVTPWPLL